MARNKIGPLNRADSCPSWKLIDSLAETTKIEAENRTTLEEPSSSSSASARTTTTSTITKSNVRIKRPAKCAVNNYVGTYISTSKTTRATPENTTHIRMSPGKQPRRWSLPVTSNSNDKVEVVSSTFFSSQNVRSKSQPRAKVPHLSYTKCNTQPPGQAKSKEMQNIVRTNPSPKSSGSTPSEENSDARKGRKTWQLHRQTSDLLQDLAENDNWTRTTTKIVVTQRISKFDFCRYHGSQ
ncbi:hypothetical protein ACHWQZ_G015147 [Mnemiopsis leidyi]